jgi:small conductance mechanosensitive channel
MRKIIDRRNLLLFVAVSLFGFPTNSKPRLFEYVARKEYAVENLTDKLWEWGALYGTKVLAAVAILVIGRIVVGILTSLVRRLLRKSNVDETLSKFVTSLTRILLMMFLIIAAVGALGVQTTSFVAIIGAAGLAVGFALQGSLANFAAGVLLIIFRPFKVGDFIDAGGATGVVQAVSIFTTVLNTPDNKKVIIPNGSITGGNIINYSAQEMRRIDLVFGIGYDEDIKKAKETLERIVAEDSRVLEDPSPTVAVSELADSSVNFVVRPWVKTADYWDVYFAITEKVKLTFDEQGISIPFPQRDIHVYETAAG